MKFLLAFLMLTAGWRAGAQGTSEAILGFTNAIQGTFTGTAGWTFQVTNAVTVTDLGCISDFFINNGTTSPLQVGLWGDGPSPLASVSVTPSSSLVGQSLYESVGEVIIGPGQTYHIGVFFGGVLYSLDVVAPALDGFVSTAQPLASLSAARGGDSAGFVSPATVPGTEGAAFLGPNFLWRDVPEPSSGLLLVLGGLLLAVRKLKRRD